MRFYFAGGAMEVGGSCIYLRAGGYGILLDSGIRQGGRTDVLPDFHGIQQRGGVDVILVSHAHMDHTGSLPVISKAYPNARIYMTKMTQDLTRVLLYDSLKLMERAEEEIPKYSQLDVVSMLNRIWPVDYQVRTQILPGVYMTAYPAGHIAGAACLYIETEEGGVFYSGDVSGFLQQTIEGIGIPKLRPDVLLLESTYGDRLHASRQIEENRLVSILAQEVKEGKKILIPAFALGRSQEVLLILRKAIQDGLLPHVPVYVDGMIRDMNRVYTAHPTYLRRNLARRILRGEEPFYTEDIQAVGSMQDRHELADRPGAAIFIASSGMLTGGPSMLYASMLLPREDACVILTGYQDEESPGRLLLKLLDDASGDEREVTLDGKHILVKSRIEMVGLSAHADSTELCGIAERLGARRVILEHGSNEAISALGAALSEDYRRKVYQPSCGEELDFQIHNKRKALPQELPFTLHRSSFDPEEDVMWLWDFCGQHYPDRAMTLDQLYYILTGKEATVGTDMAAFQEALLKEGYFTRHPKRLYLFRRNSPEERAEQMKSGEATPQEVEAFLREQMKESPIRKLSFYQDEKRVILNTDFPDAFDQDRLKECADALQETFGWALEIKPFMNHQAAGTLLQQLFGNKILKISYFQETKSYQIVLAHGIDDVDEEKARDFTIKTGWTLRIRRETDPVEQEIAVYTGAEAQEAAAGSLPEKPGWFTPDGNVERTEQNLAFSLVDQYFMEEPIRPLKKGKKNDYIGLYMELSFLTPALGARCAGLLQTIANQIGWRIHISESVNQKQLFVIAQELCSEYHLTTTKNPSYQPKSREVHLTLLPGESVPEEMKLQFREMTGLYIQG